ncbi:MAG: cytochrome c peroxidase [Bacteroidota bacterium]
MKKTFSILAIVAMAAVVYSCTKSHDTPGTTTVYLDLPASPYKYFTNSGGGGMGFTTQDSLNRRATLGRVLFYDTHLSINNTISCGSCHKQEAGFADNVALSRGFEGRLTGRNSPGINNLATFGSFFWDGREQSLKNLIMRPVSNHVEMGIDDLGALPAKLAALPYYSALFTSAFGDADVTLDRIGTSVALFLNSIGNDASKGGIVMGGGSTRPLSAEEERGKELFDTKYNCRSCHNGGFNGYGGGQTFVDIGLDAGYTDRGMGVISGQASDIGRFKVPNLTNVALTAPYMHDGRYKTLGEVVEHYSHGINNSPNLDTLLKDANGMPRQMDISESEKVAIIAFLGSLTDFETLTDAKFANPFKVK